MIDSSKRKAKGPFKGTQGWRQMLAAKKHMLDTYDCAKEQDQSHEVSTYRGNVAEAKFREWLSGFLPKRYGVTSGYIVSQLALDNQDLPHYDVILYDQIHSPVLWVETHPGTSAGGSARAVPAEHVRAVIEVKSSFSSKAARDAADHIRDLCPLLAGTDKPGSQPQRYLPSDFVTAVVFMELRQEQARSVAALNSMLIRDVPGYYGGVILRGEGLQPELSARISNEKYHTPRGTRVGKEESLLTVDPHGGTYLVLSDPVEKGEGTHLVAALAWHENVFTQFAFDLVAICNGVFVPGRVSSLHAHVFPAAMIEGL